MRLLILYKYQQDDIQKRIFWANNRPSSSGDESENALLRDEVKNLQSRVSQLESKMRRLEFNQYHNSTTESARRVYGEYHENIN